MRTRFFKGILAVTAVASMALVPATARAAEVQCRVPFSFSVNEKALPAGAYTVSTEGSLHSVLLVRGLESGAFVVASPLESRTVIGAKLVFDKYGDEYVLRQVWTGDGSGRELPRSSVERALMEKAARDEAAVQRVVVPAL